MNVEQQRSRSIGDDLSQIRILFSTIGLARQFSKLLLAAVALLLTVGGWRALAIVFSGDPTTVATAEQLRFTPWASANEPTSGLASRAVEWTTSKLGLEGLLAPRDAAWLAHNPVLDSWSFLSRPVRQMFDGNLSLSGFALLLSAAVWTIFVWALFGGAIARIAAVQLADGERVGIRDALGFAARRWTGYVWGPILPLFAVLGMAVVASLASWLLRYDVGLLAAIVLWPLLLAGGFVAAVMLLGLLFGWPLIWTTISAEGTDAFDALGRLYSYVFQRPLHYLAYTAAAMAYGILGWLLVSSFAAALVYLAVWTASWGAGTDRMARLAATMPDNAIMVAWPLPKVALPAFEGRNTVGNRARAAGFSKTGAWGARGLALWVGAVKLLAVGFGYSYFWTAATAIYFLMRYHTDGRETDEVFLDRAPPHGLPKLTRDAAGVPKVDEEPAAANRAARSAADSPAPAGDHGNGAAATSAASTRPNELEESRAENDGG